MQPTEKFLYLIDEEKIKSKGDKQLNDSQIIALFFERSERAIEETAKKYDKICRHIATNILKDSQDVEECVNDTYLGAWNAIPPHEPSVLSAYLCKIARNCALKRYQYNHMQKRNADVSVSINELEDCLAQPNSNHIETELLSQAIGAFLQTLSFENRTIFMRRYWFFDSIEDIATRFSMSESKVKSSLFRTRNKLKEHLMKEGFSI